MGRKRHAKALASVGLIAVLLGSGLGLLALSGSGSGTPALDPAVAPTTLPATTIVAAPPAHNSSPDDLAWMSLKAGDGPALLWTEYQNGINPNGTPGASGSVDSYIAGYNPRTGALVRMIPVPGHVDGVTADPSLGRLMVTSNEDANSAFYLVDPLTRSTVRFTYSPSLEVNGNGGTDSIALWHGGIYVSHSNPNDTTQPTVYRIVLDWYDHVARGYPVFWNDDVATFEPAGTSGPMALTDPDTNFVMPHAGERYAGDLATISQADGRLILAKYSGDGGPLRLTQLNLTDNVTGNLPPIDGLAVATASEGTLYAVDSKAGTIQALVTDGYARGTVFVTEPDDNGNPLLGTLDLHTGVITPLGNSFESPKELYFVPDHEGDHHDSFGSSAAPMSVSAFLSAISSDLARATLERP